MESSSSCTPGNSRTPRRTEGLSRRRFFRQTVEWWISYRGLVRVARHPYRSDGDGEVRTFGTTGLSAVGTAWCHEYSHYSLGPRCRGAPDRHGVGVADTAWVGERRNRSVVADSRRLRRRWLRRRALGRTTAFAFRACPRPR